MSSRRFDPDVEALADRLHLRAEMLNRYKTHRPRLTFGAKVLAVVIFFVVLLSVAVAGRLLLT